MTSSVSTAVNCLLSSRIATRVYSTSRPYTAGNGSRFVDDSRSHPNFYRQLLVRDKEKLSSDASGVVLVNLSRISVLSGDLSGARAILADALSTEREKGSAANPETLQLISDELRALGHGLSTSPK